MSRVFAIDQGDLGSILGQVIPKTQKWYLMPASLPLSIVRVKWSNLGNRVALSPTPQCGSYWKGAICKSSNNWYTPLLEQFFCRFQFVERSKVMLKYEFIVPKRVLNVWDKEMISDIMIAVLIKLFKRIFPHTSDKHATPKRNRWREYYAF